jgi:predicted nucleic acid-binding protein
VILVDSSVWIAARRQPAGADSVELQGLIEADEVMLALPVRIELMAGVAQRDRASLGQALTALPLAMPTEDTWRLVERWIELAARAGHRFGMADWLIAALASERGALVWTLDGDFTPMERLKFVRLYR